MTNPNLTLIAALLDRSGSMQDCKRATETGFDEMIDQQRGEPGEAIVTVICHEDGTTGWPPTRDHPFGSLGMIGGCRPGVNRGLLSASVGLPLDDELVRC